MRVLTKQEQEVFRSAYVSIMRVATVEVESHTELMANDKHLPQVYFEIVNDVGCMRELQNLYCPFRKEKAMEHLVKFCFANRIQPRDFIFEGLLSIRRQHEPVYQQTYVSESEA